MSNLGVKGATGFINESAAHAYEASKRADETLKRADEAQT